MLKYEKNSKYITEFWNTVISTYLYFQNKWKKPLKLKKKLKEFKVFCFCFFIKETQAQLLVIIVFNGHFCQLIFWAFTILFKHIRRQAFLAC